MRLNESSNSTYLRLYVGFIGPAIWATAKVILGVEAMLLGIAVIEAGALVLGSAISGVGALLALWGIRQLYAHASAMMDRGYLDVLHNHYIAGTLDNSEGAELDIGGELSEAAEEPIP